MRTFATTLTFAALALAGCGGSTDTPTPGGSDAGADVSAAADAPRGDAAAPSASYPAGPYGSRVCARLEPFSLNNCAGEPWRFADNGWSDAAATVVIISAGWCVPCQREAAVLERELVQPYADRRVRVVTIMVQDPNRMAITPAFCNTWQTRYNLTIPVLMDPQQILSPFYPGLAFPGNLIIDRQGRIRWRQYGTEMSLNSIKAAVDEVLANPNTCTP